MYLYVDHDIDIYIVVMEVAGNRNASHMKIPMIEWQPMDNKQDHPIHDQQTQYNNGGRRSLTTYDLDSIV